MLAVLGHATRTSMQHCVRCRRSVAGYDFEGTVPIGEILQVIQNIEQSRIDAMALTAAKVPQQMVYGGQAALAIRAAIEILRRQSLASVGVHKLHPPARRDHRGGGWKSRDDPQGAANGTCLLYTSDAADDLLCVDL